jgi:hypothetical protein
MEEKRKTYIVQFREQFLEDLNAHKKAGQKSRKAGTPEWE